MPQSDHLRAVGVPNAATVVLSALSARSTVTRNPECPLPTGRGPRAGRARRAVRVALVGTALLAAVLVLVTGCGNGDQGGSAGDDFADAGIDLPAECLTQFLGVTATPDLGEVDLPASWPEPPVDATLCKTQAAAGAATMSEVGYATAASPEEVLDAYAKALADHAPERTEDDGYGAGTLTGLLDGIVYVIQPRADAYEIIIAPA